VNDQTDEALMMACRQGDEAAMEMLVRRHADNLLGYLVRMTRNRAQAEDLFQETLIRVHRKADSFRPDGRFKPWLFSIATHLAVDSARSSRRQPRDDTAEVVNEIPDPRPDPSDDAARADRARLVRRAIDSLPPRQRATLVLAYFEGLNYPDVARALGCSVGTVKTQMSRALQQLARILPRPDLNGIPGGAS
jgi:RNA polymerase sigma-70 factor, ECF subfamily